MRELVVWLTACLDEDEEIARAATQGKWVWSREFVTPPGYHHRTVGPLEPGDAAFIAEHNPARALREIAAKRRVITGLQHLSRGDDPFVSSIADDSLRVLAEPYADRPDYRDEWRP
jgi:hypothetical protein